VVLVSVVVGIDPGKNKLDAVAIRDEELIPFHWSESHFTRGATLTEMRNELLSWLVSLETSIPLQLVVYVEEPLIMNSRRVGIWMAETVGMVLSLPCETHEVPVDTWKKLLGKAGMDKAEVMRIINGRFPVTRGWIQDRCDALGIALYGLEDQRFRSGVGTVPLSDPVGDQLA
jgi:Holliday junction resolvasome RuvABC endonuclease subunit